MKKQFLNSAVLRLQGEFAIQLHRQAGAEYTYRFEELGFIHHHEVEDRLHYALLDLVLGVLGLLDEQREGVQGNFLSDSNSW